MNSFGHGNRRLTLYDRIFESHLVEEQDSEAILYIDLHLIHDLHPHPFAGLRKAGRTVRRRDRTLAVADHNVPTEGQAMGVSAIADELSRQQLLTMDANTAEFGIEFYPIGDVRNGIVHVIGPEQGRTQPGMTIVCGDSHTSTHGAFGALAHGIGTSEVEHVLATQTLRQIKSGNMRITIDGRLSPGVGAKDLALGVIARIGASGGTGMVIEFAGTAVRALSMEGRMTLCNMSIEAGAKAGLIAPDETTFAYLKGRAAAPVGPDWDRALAYWMTMVSDPDAVFDREVRIDAAEIEPLITWGTSPEDVIAIGDPIPSPDSFPTEAKRKAAARSLEYMGLQPGQKMTEPAIDVVFIGSCTNSRIEDLRSAASVVGGRHVASGVRALIVPGSGLVRAQAEEEGLDRIFTAAGFEWREPGCSMCLAMNQDKTPPGQRCVSTSNRNFEGRQGPGARTHLASPAMAAAAAIAGRIVDVRDYL